MSDFTDFESFTLVDGTLYRIDRSVQWRIGSVNSDWVLDLPEGYRFDISVPWFARWILSPHDRRVLLAAAVHDRLLEIGHDIPFASSEFRRASLARGVSPWFAWMLFFATLAVTAANQSNKCRD